MSEDSEIESIRVISGSNISRRWILGLENKEVGIFALGLAISCFLLFLLNLPVSKVIVLTIAPIPFMLTTLYVFIFMHGKPPHTTGDYIEGLLSGDQFKPFSKAFTRMPDGMFYKHLLVWDGLVNGFWSCAMELEVPAIDYSKNSTKNHFMNRLSAFLSYLAKEKIRAQLFWSVNSNYACELSEYKADTDTLPEGNCKKYRELRYQQYKKLADARILRRERLVVFISYPLGKDQKISWNKSLEGYDEASAKLLEDLEHSAQIMFQRLYATLTPSGVSCRALDADALLHLLKSRFNPSLSLAPQLFKTQLSDKLSIREQIIFSDMTRCNESGASFLLDNHFYDIICLKGPIPEYVHMGMINQLTKLVGTLDYEITVNVIPKDARKVLQEEESELTLLRNQRSLKNAAASLDFDFQEKYEMIGELKTGKSTPLDVQYLISIHGISVTELIVKTTSIKAALSRMGIGFYVLNNSMSAINAFFQGTPGWLFGERSGHHFRIQDRFLAPLLPFSSTYVGLLSGAEAIYLGEQNNLVGLKQFAKPILKDSDPQHSLLFGKTGSGKSVLTADLIMQTHAFYEYTVIIDYGLSYKALAEKFGVSPIYLGPSSNITINYFDTRDLPLTGEHLSMVSMILRVMSDSLASDGMIMRYLKPFYLTWARRWYDEHQTDTELVKELAAIAFLSEKFLQNRTADDEVEAFQKASAEWRDYPFATDELKDFFYSKPEPVFYQCFSHFGVDEFPTHTQFVKFLRTKPLDDEEDYKTLQLVTDALELWQRSGKNGRLFDGVTNLEMNDSFQYFELSSVPSNDPNFKFAAGALIQLISMRKIERMERKPKKRLIIDEANSFFEIPQGAKVIENALTKFRKHRCSVLISFQQYEMLSQSKIKESITSNIQQYLLMGQTDRNDVDQLAHALGLSEPIAEAILNFETPANLPETDRYSSFAQVVKTRGMLSGIARNAMTPDLLNMIGN